MWWEMRVCVVGGEGVCGGGEGVRGGDPMRE